jgi:lysophospholipid acyltransferase (LPLAT)-like uncharacterized protein
MSEARFRAAGLFGRAFLGGLFATCRFRVDDAERWLRFRRAGQPVILVLWHEQLLPLVHERRGTGTVSLVSEHADGEYIARVIERMGMSTVRGSSTRGGIQGLKGMIRAARAGHDLALTPDGPRGPAHVFKPGALLAAQVTGLPIIPYAAAVSGAWRLGSWDRFIVPHPFSTVRVGFGEPRWIDRDAPRETLEVRARELASDLDALSERLAVAR